MSKGGRFIFPALAVGWLCLLGSLAFAAYLGAIDAPAYVHARVLWVAIIGFLLIGRDDDQSWISFIFWSVVYAALTVGVVSTVSMWLSKLMG